MDPLSLSCNVVAVLTVTSKLLTTGYSYGNAVKDFPESLRELVGELSTLSGILHALMAVMELPENSSAVAATRPDPSTIARAMTVPLEDCRKMLVNMVADLKVYQKSESRVKKVIKRLSWPLKESETKAWVEKIGRYKSTFTLGLSADELTLARTIRKELGEIKRLHTLDSQRKLATEEKEKLSKLLRWVSPADQETNHSAARKLQQFGTGKWFTEGQTFQDWLTHENSFLWLYGIRMCLYFFGAHNTKASEQNVNLIVSSNSGRWENNSFFRSIIIDRILSEVNSKGADTTVTYFYFDFKESTKQSSLGFLGSIIAQLIQKNVEFINLLEPLYQDSDQGKLLPNLQQLAGTLYEIIRRSFKVVIVIDALDECTEQPYLFQVLERLRGLKPLSLLITSRNDLGIKLQFIDLSSLSIKKDDVLVDIERFVSSELQQQPKLARLKPTTKSDIITTLVRDSNGMFRWAKCCLDQIAKLRNDKAIKAALKSLPPTLYKTYERILCTIPEEDRGLAIRVLRWLLFSRRPMTLSEIVDGIAIEIGHESMDPDNKLNEPEDILDICGGLINLDEMSFTLGLAHFTVQEYLISTDITQGPAVGYYVQRTIAHAELAKICLTYITFDGFNDGPRDDYEVRLEEYPLLTYAVKYWPEHVSEYKKDGDETLDQLVLSFFHLGSDSGKFQAWRQLYDVCRGSDRSMTASEINRSLEKIEWLPATPLYFAAGIGHLHAVNELLELGADVSVEGGEFGTPVVAAVMGGHEETLRLLLEKGANPDQERYKMPKNNLLFLAADNGYAKCLRTLLDFNADPEHFKITDSKNPLLASGWAGHGNVFEVLIEADFFRNKELHWDPIQGVLRSADNAAFMQSFYLACWQGFEKPFRTLFQKGKEVLLSSCPNPAGDIFKDATRRAIAQGHLKIIKLILQDKDAKALCVRDDMFRTLLQEAAYAGREKIVDFLLSLRKTPGPEAIGFSLHLAAANGNVNVIESLINAGANPNGVDGDGWSPILCASEYRNHSAMEKLSKVVDVSGTLGMIGRVGHNAWDVSHQPETSTNGLEIIGDQTAVFRALHPITPLSANSSLEIEIVNSRESRISIGFVDELFRYSVCGGKMFQTEPGMCGRSWGYQMFGDIMLDNEMDGQSVQRYGIGDSVGCHFDKIKNVAFFTVNGKIVGQPIADIKGKIIPIIQVGRGDHIRTNFGDKPLVYEIPTLTTEIMRNLWRPNPLVHIGVQECEPNC